MSLLALMKKQGKSKPNWTRIAEKLNLSRTGKQCRERWQNHLRPNIKKGEWTVEEEDMIQNMYQTFGPK
jgi:myb proto-oncogene protein